MQLGGGGRQALKQERRSSELKYGLRLVNLREDLARSRHRQLRGESQGSVIKQHVEESVVANNHLSINDRLISHCAP